MNALVLVIVSLLIIAGGIAVYMIFTDMLLFGEGTIVLVLILLILASAMAFYILSEEDDDEFGG